MLIKFFEKHHLSIETCNICLRSAPTLPLSLNQPVKHLLLNDLVVTGKGEALLDCIMSSSLVFFFGLINVKTFSSR